MQTAIELIETHLKSKEEARKSVLHVIDTETRKNQSRIAEYDREIASLRTALKILKSTSVDAKPLFEARGPRTDVSSSVGTGTPDK